MSDAELERDLARLRERYADKLTTLLAELEALLRAHGATEVTLVES